MPFHPPARLSRQSQHISNDVLPDHNYLTRRTFVTCIPISIALYYLQALLPLLVARGHGSPQPGGVVLHHSRVLISLGRLRALLVWPDLRRQLLEGLRKK